MSLNFPGANKFMDRMFRRADGVVWDLMTGKIGVATPDGIATIEGDGDDARITINVMDDFGIALPAFAQSTPIADIKVGDIIYTGKRETVSFVIGKSDNGKFKVMRADGTTASWTPPKVSILGFDSGVMVLRSLVSMLPSGNAGLSSMQGMLLPLIMMGGGDTSGLDLDKMLPLMLMMQGGGGDAGGGMGNMMQMMLMMKMLGGDKSMSSLFDARPSTGGKGPTFNR